MMNSILSFLFRYKTISFILCILLISYIVYSGFFTKSDDTNVGIIGTLITIIGFILTVSQLKTVEMIAKETRTEVDKAVKMVQSRIKELFSVADCAAAQRTIDEIEGYIREDKYELAVLRLKEIHKLLVVIYNDKELKNKCQKNIDSLVRDVGLDINNLVENIKTPNLIYKERITSHLRDTSIVFIEIENYLKKNTYDTNVL